MPQTLMSTQTLQLMSTQTLPAFLSPVDWNLFDVMSPNNSFCYDIDYGITKPVLLVYNLSLSMTMGKIVAPMPCRVHVLTL